MNQLRDLILSKIKLDEDALATVLSNFQEKRVKKDQFVLKERQIAREYYFVKKGAMRVYFNSQEKEITAWFALENEFFTDLSSLNNQNESKFNIQAMEDTELLTISKDKMTQLYQQFPLWQQFGREIWEKAFMNISDSIISFQTRTAEERYLDIRNNSNLINRVPLKDLASFLGVTPTSLSRIRKTIK